MFPIIGDVVIRTNSFDTHVILAPFVDATYDTPFPVYEEVMNNAFIHHKINKNVIDNTKI